MVKDVEFGLFVSKLRKEQGILLEVLCDGLCDTGKMSRIENGKVEAEKLLRDRLLGRLGVAAENYENFLYYSEYKGWKERQNIVYSILYGKREEAKQQLIKYQVEYCMEEPLEYQFYLSMLAQIRRQEGAKEEELFEIFQKAVYLTISEPLEKKLVSRRLSMDELNLLLEYVFYNKEALSLDWMEEFISYIQQFSLDKLALSKIYPKTIYYFYQVWKEKKGILQIGKMLKYCNKAIELLQKVNRMYYLWELLEIKMKLLQQLIEENLGKSENAVKRLNEWYQTCKNWLETLIGLYEDYGISKPMQDFCYIYMDMEAYCIGDVIRIRRKMLGMTMKELSEGICSERTISRLERNQTDPQREIVRLLFERLHMSMEFCKSDLLTSNPEAKRLFGELKQSSNRMECEKVDQLLEQVKSMISLDIPENKQAIRRSEIVNENNKKKQKKEIVDKKWHINMLKEALEYTIPYEVAIASGEKYLTQNELSCLQNMMNGLDWSYKEMEECVQVLYDLFEHQRQISDCLNMYEFVMGAVASFLGNKGEYDSSDEIKIKILKNTIVNHRLGVINRTLYGLLWNDEQRKKEQHPVKRDVDVKKELKKCIYFGEMCGDTQGILFLEKKLNNGM